MRNSVEYDIRFACLNYGKLGLQEESYEIMKVNYSTNVPHYIRSTMNHLTY